MLHHIQGQCIKIIQSKMTLMYVHIFGYLVNKLEIWWVYLSPIDSESKRYGKIFKIIITYTSKLNC